MNFNILKQYQGDAWSRRISSDFKNFPWYLKALFMLTHYLYKVHYILVISCAAITLYYMHKIVDGTWVTGDYALLSHSPFWTACYTYMFLSVFILVLPYVLKFVLYNWYWFIRKNFNKDSDIRVSP